MNFDEKIKGAVLEEFQKVANELHEKRKGAPKGTKWHGGKQMLKGWFGYRLKKKLKSGEYAGGKTIPTSHRFRVKKRGGRYVITRTA